jgi:hypothetical protein
MYEELRRCVGRRWKWDSVKVVEVSGEIEWVKEMFAVERREWLRERTGGVMEDICFVCQLEEMRLEERDMEEKEGLMEGLLWICAGSVGNVGCCGEIRTSGKLEKCSRGFASGRSDM